jgi:hypothetical protein
MLRTFTNKYIYIANCNQKVCTSNIKVWLRHRYAQSKSEKQLRNAKGENDVGSCSPLSHTANNEPIVPCGLIAWSLFNDTYRIFSNDKELKINKKDIAWKSDKHGKFGSDVHPKNFQTEGLIGGGKLDENIPVSIIFKQVLLVLFFRER